MHPRVLHVLATDDRRGAESFALALSVELRARGWQSGEVALARGHTDTGHGVMLLGPRRLSVQSLRRLRRMSRSADIVVAHGSTTLPACAIALLGTGVPFVYVNIGDPLYWASSRSRRFRVRRLLARASHVASISRGSAATLVRCFDVATDRVTTIPNGRSAADFPYAGAAARTAARGALDIPADQLTVLFLGALSPEKRVDVAIDAVARVTDAHLLVVGAGPIRSELEQHAAVAAPGRVRFLGPSDQPAQALAAADVLVLPSDSEGLPGVLIEAGLTGVPAVATDVGWVSDVVIDGETGFVVPSGRDDLVATAIERALADRERLGRAARARCLAEFEMDVVVSAWSRLLRQTAEKSGRWRARRVVATSQDASSGLRRP
jgi:glycosyltransferase involved in cell wall biosynthesis